MKWLCKIFGHRWGAWQKPVFGVTCKFCLRCFYDEFAILKSEFPTEHDPCLTVTHK